MKSIVTLLGGILIGAAVTFLVVDSRSRSGGTGDEAGTAARLRAENEKLGDTVQTLNETLRDTRERGRTLEAERARLQGEVFRLREAAARSAEASADPAVAAAEASAAEAAPTGPVTEKELLAGVEEFGASLQQVILGEGGEEAVAKLRALLDRAGPEGLRTLIGKFESEEEGMMRKTLLAHALAQSGKPEALKALADVLADPDRGLIDRRTAAHGLAFCDEDAAVPALRRAAEHDPDSGARANAAFGLARRGLPEGIGLYAKATDEAFAKSDPAALQYLSGFALLGKKAAPVMRERLTKYEDPQARLVLIELLRGQKDTDSIPTLRGLVNSADTDKDVRAAAEKALRDLETE